jgi:hypothetical protein
MVEVANSISYPMVGRYFEWNMKICEQIKV